MRNSKNQGLISVGYLKVDELIPHELCLLIYNMECNEGQEISRTDQVSIHNATYRSDTPIQLSNTVKDIQKIVLTNLSEAFIEVLGNNIKLVELSILTSFPGAECQPKHPDSENHANPNESELLTVFIPLVDISRAMGPIEVFPSSNTVLYGEDEDPLTNDRNGIALESKKGDCIVINSKIWHRGLDNFSNKKRPVLYFSYIGEGLEPDGPTWTIRPKESKEMDFFSLKNA